METKKKNNFVDDTKVFCKEDVDLRRTNMNWGKSLLLSILIHISHIITICYVLEKPMIITGLKCLYGLDMPDCATTFSLTFTPYYGGLFQSAFLSLVLVIHNIIVAVKEYVSPKYGNNFQSPIWRCFSNGGLLYLLAFLFYYIQLVFGVGPLILMKEKLIFNEELWFPSHVVLMYTSKIFGMFKLQVQLFAFWLKSFRVKQSCEMKTANQFGNYKNSDIIGQRTNERVKFKKTRKNLIFSEADSVQSSTGCACADEYDTDVECCTQNADNKLTTTEVRNNNEVFVDAYDCEDSTNESIGTVNGDGSLSEAASTDDEQTWDYIDEDDWKTEDDYTDAASTDHEQTSGYIYNEEDLITEDDCTDGVFTDDEQIRGCTHNDEDWTTEDGGTEADDEQTSGYSYNEEEWINEDDSTDDESRIDDEICTTRAYTGGDVQNSGENENNEFLAQVDYSGEENYTHEAFSADRFNNIEGCIQKTCITDVIKGTVHADGINTNAEYQADAYWHDVYSDDEGQDRYIEDEACNSSTNEEYYSDSACVKNFYTDGVHVEGCCTDDDCHIDASCIRDDCADEEYYTDKRTFTEFDCDEEFQCGGTSLAEGCNTSENNHNPTFTDDDSCIVCSVQKTPNEVDLAIENHTNKGWSEDEDDDDYSYQSHQDTNIQNQHVNSGVDYTKVKSTKLKKIVNSVRKKLQNNQITITKVRKLVITCNEQIVNGADDSVELILTGQKLEAEETSVAEIVYNQNVNQETDSEYLSSQSNDVAHTCFEHKQMKHANYEQLEEWNQNEYLRRLNVVSNTQNCNQKCKVQDEKNWIDERREHFITEETHNRDNDFVDYAEKNATNCVCCSKPQTKTFRDDLKKYIVRFNRNRRLTDNHGSCKNINDRGVNASCKIMNYAEKTSKSVDQCEGTAFHSGAHYSPADDSNSQIEDAEDAINFFDCDNTSAKSKQNYGAQGSGYSCETTIENRAMVNVQVNIESVESRSETGQVNYDYGYIKRVEKRLCKKFRQNKHY